MNSWLPVVIAALALLAIPSLPSPETRLPVRELSVTTKSARQTSRWLPLWSGLVVALLLMATGGWAAVGTTVPIGLVTGGGVWWITRRRRRRSNPAQDSLRLAATWDLLAACLRSGLPVATAVQAVADSAPESAAEALRSAGGLLALGADPVGAWESAQACPEVAELARAARRSAKSGVSMADTCTELAERLRSSVLDETETRAQRAGVLMAGPLGLCFLPAFLCLGVIPVVMGLASQLTTFS